MKLIGDPHLGREFRAHVPLDRIGDREKMMFEQFERELNESSDTTVIVGDLFDRPLVSIQTLWKTLDIIISASASQPNRKIIIMAGNHDLNKATEVRGSFHVLGVALERVPNVYVLLEPTVIDDVAYFPWQYEKTAEEQVEVFNALPSTAIGHWDLESFGDHDSHLCPARSLRAKGVDTIYSGHWHIAGTYTVDSFDVICTGSMQPMTHAEDPKGNMYVTLNLTDYEAKDDSYFANRYVRVRCIKGEEVTPPTTCLGFKLEPIDPEAVETERVNLGNFDMNDILNQAFTSFEIPTEIQSFIKEKIHAYG